MSPAQKIRDLLQEGERVEAAEAFHKLPQEQKGRVRDTLNSDQHGALWQGQIKAERQEAGTEQAFQALPEQGKVLAMNVQYIENDVSSSERIESVKKDISRLSEQQRDRLREALPEASRSVLSEIESSIGASEGKSQSEDSSQSEDEDRGRDTPDYDRGRGMGM